MMLKKYISICLVLFSLVLIQNCQKKDNKITSKELEVMKDSMGIFSFKVPKGLFKQSESRTFYSKKYNSKIFIETLSDNIGGLDGVFTKQELIEHYKKDLTNVSFESKKDYFVIKGNDSLKNNIYLRGYYNSLDRILSKEENPSKEDKYIVIATKAVIIKVESPKTKLKDFEAIIPEIFNSFKFDWSDL